MACKAAAMRQSGRVWKDIQSQYDEPMSLDAGQILSSEPAFAV